MASCGTRDPIKAKLHTFIANYQPLGRDGYTECREPLIILYSQSNIGLLRNHPKVKELEAIGKQTAQFQKSKVLFRADLRARVLFQVTIHNSNLVKCTLIGCTIFGSSFKYSHLIDCQVLKDALGEHDVPSMSCISNCQIENGTVSDSNIADSTCKGMGFAQSCTLENNLILRTSALTSTLINCGVHASELRACEVTEGFLTESVIQSKPVSLHALPVEIRRICYSYAIANEGLASNLMAALRPDSLLYGEVLETLFAEHTFVLERQNHEAVRSMPKRTTQRVTKLCLKTGWAALESEDDVSLYIPPGTRITDIQLEFQGQTVNIREFYAVTKLWFRYLGTVRTFTLVWTVLLNDESEDKFEPPEALNCCIRIANKWLKREAMFVKGESPKEYTSSVSSIFRGRVHTEETVTWTWTWMAEKGSVLLWNS
ncbi:hypothetical protein LOCC1_G007918 [Lachnellula occidentalis]|uniref:Uncharacterized protein n=1 Tax=Lachnellula occidentalis TaxID=215460 RepID=A0A8H8U9I7_9HELO|nr:hypothetical protein LOCC1_G007918 [Lachnellula occidentalis]